MKDYGKNSIWERIATVNGYTIDRLKGSQRYYHLRLDDKKSMVFHTQKAAKEMAAKLDRKGK